MARLVVASSVSGSMLLASWNLWLYAVIYMALIGMVTTSFVAYALEPGAAWITASKWIVLATSFALIAALILLARVGFHLASG